MNNDGDNFLVGGKEVATKFGIKVSTAVRVDYVRNKWWFELTIMEEYTVNGSGHVPDVEHFADIGSEEESVASNIIEEDEVAEEGEVVEYYHFEKPETKSMAGRNKPQVMACCLKIFD